MINHFTKIITKISQLRIELQIAIASTLAFFLILLGYTVIVQPLHFQLQNIHTQQAIISAQIKNKQLAIQQLARMQQQANKTQPSIKSSPLTNNLLHQFDLPILLKNIAALANTTHITIVALKPENVQSNQEITYQDTNLTAIGTYEQICNFVIKVQQAKLLTAAIAFTLRSASNDEADNPLANTTVNIIIRTYAFAPITALPQQKTSIVNRNKVIFKPNPVAQDGDASKTIMPATLAATAVASNDNTTPQLSNTPPASENPQPILWENQNLQFLGTMQHNNQTWGIVSDPSGKIHYVTTGDTINTNKSKITRITDTGIITENEGDNVYR